MTDGFVHYYSSRFDKVSANVHADAYIADIKLDPKSRDDIPQLLRGLQHIHTDPELRKSVFAILGEMLPERSGEEGKGSPSTGHPGMAQWTILVLGVLRLGLNADYDRIQELANQHATLRLMLGHGDWSDESRYELQTIKDNLQLFTPEILDRINREVVCAGHPIWLIRADADELAQLKSWRDESLPHPKSGEVR